jgi:hypothetical protein
MVEMFQLIYRKQSIITNLQQIKELLLRNSFMDFVCIMAEVFQLICRKQSIITNLQQIKDRLMLN